MTRWRWNDVDRVKSEIRNPKSEGRRKRGRSPRAKGGNPKSEIRNPKPETGVRAEGLRTQAGYRSRRAATIVGTLGAVSNSESEFWTWGGESDGDGLELREDAGAGAQEPEDLLERSTRFAEAVLRLVRRIPRSPVTNRLIDQLVGASSSIGANYCEADDAVSKKDCRNRIGTSRKESKETMFFLRLLATADPEFADETRQLWREARELNQIFGAIWRKLG
ncbi:MAG: four helix bundle protein [Verrucomicrobiales bacterium]|nr:four helix bundle protein [Verrucomicrobiales bacterium]